jgi:hypothetical protein
MPVLDITSCRAKLVRAEVHRDALYTLDRTMDQVECPTLGIKFNADTGEHVIYVSRMPDYSSAFTQASLILGDAVHNLRATLDHLIYALADWNTAGSIQHPYRTQFPICDTPSDFNAASKRYLREVHSNHVAVIERFQTYHAVDLLPGKLHPLALLRDLSDVDKHRLLNVVVIPTRAYVVNFDLIGLADRLGQARLVKWAELGAEVNRYVLRERLPDMEVIGHIPASVSLPEIGQPLRFTLRTLEQYIAQIIEAFEPLTH